MGHLGTKIVVRCLRNKMSVDVWELNSWQGSQELKWLQGGRKMVVEA